MIKRAKQKKTRKIQPIKFYRKTKEKKYKTTFSNIHMQQQNLCVYSPKYKFFFFWIKIQLTNNLKYCNNKKELKKY